ncbi:hypothetical protein GCM10022393_08070 [Aquimarina addita]|uniref:Uncharacterized protein n=1 Tax=Aquimarina addita TaxID=870485 RepID=A0ABP7XBQ2_9FLAO
MCFPEIIIDPCEFIPCWLDDLDPWILYEKLDPKEFFSIKDKLGLELDSKSGAIPFALNEGVIGLQFYNKNDLMSFNKDGNAVFILKEATIFDVEISENIGLQGNVVNPGEYPIIFNEENETFNIIANVEEGFKK